jgi:hypothetical protein
MMFFSRNILILQKYIEISNQNKLEINLFIHTYSFPFTITL